jgi:hypothetical protein
MIGLQRFEGFAQGTAADLQTAGQRRLDQTFAGPQRTGANGFHQALGNDLRQRTLRRQSPGLVRR